MRIFVKLSIAAIALGATLFWAAGPLAAAEVAKGDNGTLSVGGFVNGRFGLLTPKGSMTAGDEDAPASFQGHGEGAIMITAKTADGEVEGHIDNRIRGQSGQLGGASANGGYLTGAWGTWVPMENLRINAGLIGYLEFEERTTHWENYVGFRPIPVGDEYQWFPENKRALDVTYAIPGDMRIEVGLWIPTDPATYNRDGGNTQAKTYGGSGYDPAAPSTPMVKSAYVPHVLVRAADWMVSALYGSETLAVSDPTGGGGGWNDSEESANTGMVIVARYNYCPTCFAKAGITTTTYDKFNIDGALAEETHTAMAVAVQQGIGGPYAVYLEYMSTTDENGIKDQDRTWMRVGVKKSFVGGSRVHLDYESNDAKYGGFDPDPDTFIAVSIVQNY
jgi:hypothetical protein